MRTRERIPIHNHADLNSGGLVAQSTSLTLVTSSGDSGGGSAGYQPTSEKGVANGYASLGAGGLVPMAQLATGTPDGTKFVRDDGTLAAAPGASGGDSVGQFIAGWDGGGSAITAGAKVDIVAPFSGTITGWTLLADVSGSAVVDVWRDTYANFPPTVADTITAAAKPTLTGATKATGSPTGWTTAVTAGDVLRFNLDSAATITRLLLVISYSRP